MIVGTGLDIVEIDRVQRIYDHFGDAFAARILCDSEMSDYKNSRFPVRFLSRRFAAKEAVAKALGTGFSKGINPRMICVEHDDHGRPLVKLSEVASERAEQMNAQVSWISISDERLYAAAFVVMESGQL